MDEYGRRIEKAMAAERLEELDAVLSDLPILRIADPSSPGESADRHRREHGDSQKPRRASRLFGEIPSSGGGGDRLLGEGTLNAGGRRTAATLTALLAVLVVVAAVVLVVAASWTWAAVLVGGWLIGLVQAATARRRTG